MTCSVCAAQGGLCFTCVRSLRERLLQADWLAVELQREIVRQAQGRERYRIGGVSAVTPLTFDDDASEAAWVLANTLQVWAADAGGPQRGLIGGWLADHVVLLARLPDSLVCATEIVSALDYGWRIIDRGTDAQPGTVDRDRAAGLYVSPVEAQRFLGVRADVIRQWATRGRIVAVDGFYRVGDIMALKSGR